jgi:YggT family protein
MGRPWWYDSYWEKEQRPQRSPQLPKRKTLVWVSLILLSLILAMTRTGFQPLVLDWFVGFIYYFCRILTYVIFARVILSWFNLRRSNILLVLLDDITEPILSPLRRIVPRLGIFDISPLIAIGILYFIPFVITLLTS